MRIDAHQHFWLMKDRQGQWPPPSLEAIYRDFSPLDLKPLLDAQSIDGTVLVQTMESEAETAYMLDLAAKNRFIKGVVGWTDLKAPGAVEAIKALSANPLLKGFRPMLQGLEDDNWIDDPALDPAIDAMIASGLVFDALVLPRHLPALFKFVSRHSGLKVVIDHGAKPWIATGHYSEWRQNMAALAGLPNVSCKLSGLLTEAGEQKPQAVRPYAETILELFGPSRVIWGSDWPVLRLAGDYAGWLEMCRDIVPQQHHDAVFGGNAISFYNLTDRRSFSENR
ncbi:amidohydrolase [Agrobacterium sp.]|jgi:L-fuconolactonase|uniref:amidohydrolase family protein n=1 Tax=Agrobacterium sp. TaxID=361 RepID=UPI0028A8985B|nr:amidohydrolase [Agrobacterium sp.]